MLAGLLALIAAAVFFGAAFYVGAVEHPARMTLDDRAGLSQWQPAYKRGVLMQAPLAIAGFLLGLAAWWQTANILWLIGAVVLIANWPYTLIAIMPVNKALTALPPKNAGPHSRTLLDRWAMLHAGRTVLGSAATVFFLLAAYAGL